MRGMAARGISASGEKAHSTVFKGLKFTLCGSSGYVTLNVPSGMDVQLQYSTDEQTWYDYVNSSEIALQSSGSYVCFRAGSSTSSRTTNPSMAGCTFSFSCGAGDTDHFEASGDIQSLLSQSLSKVISAENCFAGMFRQCSALWQPPKLGATILSKGCYKNMFIESGVRSTPILPATVLTERCYESMFEECEYLSQISTIYAKTMASYSCYKMFYRIGNFTMSGFTMPDLIAETLAEHCYDRMFSFSYIDMAPRILAKQMAPYCCYEMFSSTPSLYSVPADMLPEVALAEHCYEDMFGGGSVNTAPAIRSTQLASYCCCEMFSYSATIRTPANMFPATTLAPHCYEDMFKGCEGFGGYGIASGLELPATNLAVACYKGMFYGCSYMDATVASLPATNAVESCYEQMFYGCISLTAAPYLAFTEASEYSCRQMFYGCTSLTKVETAQTTFDGCDEWLPEFADSSSESSSDDTTRLFLCNQALRHELATYGRSTSTVPYGWKLEQDYSGLKFTATEATSTVFLRNITSEYPSAVNLEVSEDGMTWRDYNIEYDASNVVAVGDPIILSNIGDYVYFRAKSGGNATFEHWNFQTIGGVSASGNLHSILSAEMPETLTMNSCFKKLFYDSPGLTSVENLSLPSTTLTPYCYQYMFCGCQKLTTVMASLPATVMASYCYSGMFENCHIGGRIPNMNIVTAAANCCSDMFYCYPGRSESSEYGNYITSGSVTIRSYADSSYADMFYGCWLEGNPANFTSEGELAPHCCSGMFSWVNHDREAYSVGAACPVRATLAESCFSSMYANSDVYFGSDWAYVTTTAAKYCFENMFRYASLWGGDGTSGLMEIGASTLAEGCFMQMFEGADVNGDPSNWRCVIDAPGDGATDCMAAMFRGAPIMNIETNQEFIGAQYCGGWLSEASASSPLYFKCSNTLAAKIGSEGRSNSTVPSNWSLNENPLCKAFKISTTTTASAKVYLTSYGSPPSIALEYSTDGWTWSTYTLGTSVTVHGTASGYNRSVFFRAESTNDRLASSDSNFHQFKITGGPVVLGGCLNSLLEKDFNTDGTVIDFDDYIHDHAFTSLFMDCTTITSAGDLTLVINDNAEVLPQLCYSGTFYGCTAMRTAPELKSRLTSGYLPYSMMFANSGVNYIRTNQIQIGEYTTSGWLFNVGGTGTFACSQSLANDIASIGRGGDTVPEEWTITII